MSKRKVLFPKFASILFQKKPKIEQQDMHDLERHESRGLTHQKTANRRNEEVWTIKHASEACMRRILS